MGLGGCVFVAVPVPVSENISRGRAFSVEMWTDRFVIVMYNRVWDVGGSELRVIENAGERGTNGKQVQAKTETGGT